MTENKRFQWVYIKDNSLELRDNGIVKIFNNERLEEFLNELSDENEQLKKENQKYKSLLQDMGLLMSDEEVVDIRNEISDKLLKPLLKENGFDVDINTDDGFKIIPNGGDVE